MSALFGLLAVGCADKAKPDYDRCVAADERGDVLAAATACEAAVSADPTSTSGKEAASKLTGMKPYIAKAKAEKDPKLIAKAAEEAAAAKAAQDAEEAKCPRWATVCTLGRHPDGSEKTTGQQTFPTKAACEGAGASLGLKCDPCRCFN